MKEIKQYAVRFYGGPEGYQKGIRAQIYLFDQTNVLIGTIQFVDDGRSLPEDYQSGSRITMAMYMKDLPAMVDILRNESPVFIGWQSTIQNAVISTMQEPIGEGE